MGAGQPCESGDVLQALIAAPDWRNRVKSNVALRCSRTLPTRTAVPILEHCSEDAGLIFVYVGARSGRVTRAQPLFGAQTCRLCRFVCRKLPIHFWPRLCRRAKLNDSRSDRSFDEDAPPTVNADVGNVSVAPSAGGWTNAGSAQLSLRHGKPGQEVERTAAPHAVTFRAMSPNPPPT